MNEKKMKKRTIVGIIAILAILLTGIVFAATDPALGIISDKNYAIEIVDNGEIGQDIPNDENIEVRTIVLNPDQVSDEMTLETRIKNKNESKNKQVMIVLDTSYSMDVNAENNDVKATARDLASQLFADVANIQIGVADCSGVKNNLVSNTAANVNSVRNAITNASGGYDIADALDAAKTRLTPNENTEAYVIVFTDATDSVDLSSFSNDNIKVISVLTGITSSSFGTPSSPVPSDGVVFMYDDYTTDELKNEMVKNLNKQVSGLSTEIQFNSEILKDANRGHFKLEIVDENTKGTAVQNSDGTISWNITDPLNAGDTYKVQYKLKLNTSATIGTDALYNDIKVVKYLKTQYTNGDKTNSVEGTDLKPTIQIADAYDLEIKAVGKDSTAPAPGVKFDVTGVTQSGQIVIAERGLVADEDGYVTVKSITKLGILNFTIAPNTEGMMGYEETDAVNVMINNEYTDVGGNLTVAYDNAHEEIDDNGKRKVTVEVPIELQRFKFVIDTFDLVDSDLKLPGIDFRLIQPKLNNKYEMEALYGTTDRDGKIEFEASIMSEAGTYDYLLSQMNDKNGYENVGNATIKVTFDDQGKVVEDGVETRYNSNIEGVRVSDSEVLLRIKEKCNSDSRFNINIDLSNEDNSEEKINGAVYEVTVTKIDNSTSQNDVVKYSKVTDADGKISLVASATEEGYTKIDLHQVSTSNAYIVDSTDKEIIINRQNGIIYEVTMGGEYTKKDPENNNGIIVTLKNKRKAEANVIRMHLTQDDDIDMNLINVPMILTDVTEEVLGKENPQKIDYTATTNRDGYADFTLPDPATIKNGTYYYEIKPEYVPTGYCEPEDGKVARIKVTISEGRIVDIEDLATGGQYISIRNQTIKNEDTGTVIKVYGYADYALTPSSGGSSYIKIKLTDSDSGAPVQYGKYEIRMERNGAEIANAGSNGKYTGSNGETKNMSIPGLDSEPVTIIVSQVYDATRQNGYKTDARIYRFEVRQTDEGMQLISATLDDGSRLPQGMAVDFEDKNKDSKMDTLVFNHTNSVLNAGDVILDFSVVKYDYITKYPDQTEDLIMWSDDFLIYDPTTMGYEDFSRENPYNPMKTGEYTGSNYSAGQIKVKLKPAEDTLPKVQDPNRDGYPTGGAKVHIAEYYQNPVTGETGIVEGTEYQVQINFTYSKETGTYKYSGYSNLSNWALLKEFHHSTSQNSGEGYVESAELELWTNYGETANFAIDMSKYNFKGQELVGAKYKVKIALPTGKFVSITQPVINGDKTIEVPNGYIKEGSIITISEEEAPIGYEVDRQDTSFIVNSINSSGVVSLSNYGEQNPRITLNGSYMDTLTTGDLKFVQKIKLIDLEKDNTIVEINSKNKLTGEATKGNTYKMVTDTGNSKISTVTDDGGYSKNYIGGKQINNYMEYTITQNLDDGTSVSRFYKRLANPIKVKLYFDANGIIDNNPNSETYYGNLCGQVDPNYGQTWYIDHTDENGFSIVILQDKEDPLNVNVKTQDKFTNASLVNIAKYKVTPTEELSGEGETSLQVGYVDPNNTVTYTIEADVNEKYIGIPNQQFTVLYAPNGTISSVSVAPDATRLTAVKNTSDPRGVDLVVTLEPAVPFAIHTTDYFTGSNLQGAKYTIERESDNVVSNEKTTDANGNTVVYDGDFGEGTVDGNKSYIYKVKQNAAAYKYATAQEFRIKVDYDTNRKIVGASIYEETTSTNKLVTVSYVQPSRYTDIGYNGNDKGIVKLEIKNYPAFNIEFTNQDRIDSSIKLSGAKYSITSNISTSTTTNGTDLNGQETAYVDKTLFGDTITYEITEVQPSVGYQKLGSSIKIEVDFDSNGYVNVSNANAVRIIQGNDYAETSLINPPTTDLEKFGIRMTVKSSPIFRINIDNIDRKDYNLGTTTNLGGARYKITSDYNTSANILKPTEDTAVAEVGETPINNYVTYTIKEEEAVVGYQTIENDIKVKVHFNVNGCVDDVKLDTNNSAYATANKIENITSSVDNFAIDLSIRNNPLIDLKINNVNDEGYALDNIKYGISAKVKNTNDAIFEDTQSTISGLTEFGIDRALDNKTIVYTIHENTNTVGYEYIPNDLVVEITYDNQGRISKDNSGKYRISLTPQVEWAKITNTDDYAFGIEIVHERIREIGINLNVYDKYDEAKKVNNAIIKAYLSKDGNAYNENPNHITTLKSGEVDNGKDYKTIGKIEKETIYDEQTGQEKEVTLTSATLVLKEIQTPNEYYDANEDVTKENIYMSWAYRRIQSGAINLTFTDEGKIATATLAPDSVGTTVLGIRLDKQYITNVSVDEHNRYMLNIDLRYYPMLEMNIKAVSDDTYDRSTNTMDDELTAYYDIKPQHYNDYLSTYNSETQNLRRGLLKAGYVGTSNYGGEIPASKYDVQSYKNTGLWTGERLEETNADDVAEGGRIRYIYIYEPGGERSEPSRETRTDQLQYQQHGQQDYSPMYTSYNNALIGAVQVLYDRKGNIIETKVLEDKGAYSRNRAEQGDTSKYITATISDNKHGVDVKIQYKRATTIEASVVDNITEEQLTDITLSPCLGGTANTNRLYKYVGGAQEINLASSAVNSWTYWGGNDANGTRKYVIGTRFNNGTTYNGYENIGNVVLEIHYDEFGYIDVENSRVLSTNSAGEPNATFSASRGTIYLKIIASRKFDIKINKVDKFDQSKVLSDARFAITSSENDIVNSSGQISNLKTDIAEGRRTQVGLMHKLSVVEYTISETYTPKGYIPIDAIKLIVVFDNDGVITKITLEDGTILYNMYSPVNYSNSSDIIKVIGVADKYNRLKPQDINDLIIEIKNEPKFETNVTLTDKFYTNETINGIRYSIKDTTHNVNASGDTVTNDNGKINTYTGSVYPNETVRYVLTQNETPAGYESNSTSNIVDVTFDDNGYIKTFVQVSGNDVVTTVNNNRGLHVQASNKPRDIKIGIDKDLEGVEFKVTTEEINSNATARSYDLVTKEDGTTTGVIDTFTTSTSGKEMLYTITETKQLDGYRRIEDIQIKVNYKSDGSMDYYDVVSNPSEVGVDIATSGNFKQLSNGDKVHIKLSIVNDNKYNLVVIDEAKDVNNVRIQGTLYNVTINGELQEEERPINRTTNSSGKIYFTNRTEMENINIRVTEAKVGNGYRENSANSLDLIIFKGVETYSLDINQSNFAEKGYTLVSGPYDTFDNEYGSGKGYVIQLSDNSTEAIVTLYEGTGNVTITFKNETKSMLNITKIDAENSERVLQGAEFEVIAEEVDSYGNVQANGYNKTITTSAITNEDGNVSIDIGNRLPDKKIKYTFKEKTPPDGYNVTIEDVAIIYSYDANAKITSNESQSRRRISGDPSWYDINVKIKNGDIETYTVKVVSVDSRKGSTATGQSNVRINGSEFNIHVTDSEGNPIDGAEREGVKTARGTDSFGYTEDGIIKISGLKAEGTISVNIAQTGYVEGFIPGDNATSGTVKFDNTFVKETDSSKPEVSLSRLVANDFVDSYINEDENEVVIKVYNDPQIKLNLHKIDIDTEEKIEGAKFTVTSQIDGQNKRATIKTDLNVVAQTDDKGNIIVPIGAPEYGKVVIYTLKEEKLADYEQLSDVKLRITYDAYGRIADYEVLTEESFAQIKDSIKKVNDEYLWKTYTDEEMSQFTDEIEEIQTKASRQINLLVKNKASQKVIPYTIIVQPVDENKVPISGMKLDFSLTQGIGGTPTYPIKTTDENGEATYVADGSDRIEIKITVIDGKDYTFAENLNYMLFKNSTSGWIDDLGGNNIYIDEGDLDQENHTVKLTILCEAGENKYSVALMKIDKASGSTIIDNPARISITRKELTEEGVPEDIEEVPEDADEQFDSGEDSEETYVENTITSNKETNSNGIISISDLDMPDEVGTYTYRVYEKQSPTGYKKLEEPVEFDVTFGHDETGAKVIKSAESKDKNNLDVRHTDKGITILLYNREEVDADQYMLNIFKVDAETNEKLNGAVFKVKLADEDGTYVYTESGEKADKDGQLDYCYIEQEKDYEVRLKHMTRPTVQEIESTGSDVLTHTYVFQEIAAPEGYATDRTEVELKIEFEVADDGNGEKFVKIRSANSSDENILKITDIGEDQISADILNNEEANSYIVHYDANTQDTVEVPNDQIKVAGSPLTIDSMIPQREGFTFVEWNTQADGEGTAFNPTGSYGIDADVTLYAKWKQAEYKIEYEANAPINDYTGVAVGLVNNIPENQMKLHDEDIGLDEAIPTIQNMTEYYEFDSWNTAVDGTGIKYNPGDVYNVNSDIKLYAQWTYSVIYNANVPKDQMGFLMGTPDNIPNKQTENINNSESIIIDNSEVYRTVPTMDGYKFKEWNTKADGTGDSYNQNDTYTEKVTLELYAIWEYEIKYDENKPLDSDGFVTDITINNIPNTQVEKADLVTGTTTITIDSVENVPSTTPDDYKFKEWNTKADGTGDSYKSGDSYNGNIGMTLYAIWEPRETIKDLYLTSEKYQITNVSFTNNKNYETITENMNQYNNGDKYLLGINPYIKNLIGEQNEDNRGTTIAEFKQNIETNANEIKILKNDGVTEITDENELIATGYVLKLTKQDKEITLNLVVRGDCWTKSINKTTGPDGQLVASDYTKLKVQVASGLDSSISPIQDECTKLALDVNLDKIINARDVTYTGKAITNYNCNYLVSNNVN